MIRYKLLKTQLTGNVYAQQVESQPFSLDELKEKVKKRYGSISAAVIDETFRIMAEQLGEGHTVSIDDFGTYSLRLGMAKQDIKDFDDVRSQDIRINGIRFNAAKNLRDHIGRQEIHLQQGDKVRRHITIDDRWHLLYDHLLDQQRNTGTPLRDQTVTVTTYRALTGCTDYTARKELAMFEEAGKLRAIQVGRTKGYMIRLQDTTVM